MCLAITINHGLSQQEQAQAYICLLSSLMAAKIGSFCFYSLLNNKNQLIWSIITEIQHIHQEIQGKTWFICMPVHALASYKSKPDTFGLLHMYEFSCFQQLQNQNKLESLTTFTSSQLALKVQEPYSPSPQQICFLLTLVRFFCSLC